MNARIAIVLYKSKTLANGDHPLMLRISKNRKVKYASMGISCPLKYWDEDKQLPKRNHPQRELIEAIISKKLTAYHTKLLEFKSEDKDFTAGTLITNIEGKKKQVSVFQFLDILIDRLVQAKKIGNAHTYKDTKRVLSKFTSDSDLTFAELDYSFLTNFELSMRKSGWQETSMSVYFRTLRAVYNKAIAEGLARQQEYPFQKFKIAKFDTATKKRALQKSDVKKIEAIQIEEQSSSYVSRQYFLFMYYGQGINFIDIANLKWSNIVGDRIFYTRSKTGKHLHFKLLEPAKDILEYWRPISGHDKENYIFPILSADRHVTAVQKDNRIHKVLTRVNRDLKDIGKLAEIPIPLTTYVARHTFATVLKRTGVKTAIISEMLGHQTEAITQTYLDSFENEIVDQAMDNLL